MLILFDYAFLSKFLQQKYSDFGREDGNLIMTDYTFLNIYFSENQFFRSTANS